MSNNKQSSLDKEFVLYQEALALKELGFDEPCFGYWYTEQEDCKKVDVQISTVDFLGDEPDYILAPTYSQAFRWFREKYQLQGYVYSTTVRGGDNGKHFSDYCWNINGIDSHFMKTDARDMEKVTYEEAELACLRRLIEIVQGGNK